MKQINWQRSGITKGLDDARDRRRKWLENDRVKLSAIQARKAAINRAKARKAARELHKKIINSPRVAVIHWVKDTPFSLTTAFLEWRNRNEQG